MVKDDYALISLRQLTGEETDLDEVRDNGKGAREPPTAPEPFATGLARDLQSGAKGFTHKGDLGLVTGTYDKAFETEMEQADELYYIGMKWSDAEGVALVGALRAATSAAGCSSWRRSTSATTRWATRPPRPWRRSSRRARCQS